MQHVRINVGREAPPGVVQDGDWQMFESTLRIEKKAPRKVSSAKKYKNEQ